MLVLIVNSAQVGLGQVVGVQECFRVLLPVRPFLECVKVGGMTYIVHIVWDGGAFLGILKFLELLLLEKICFLYEGGLHIHEVQVLQGEGHLLEAQIRATLGHVGILLYLGLDKMDVYVFQILPPRNRVHCLRSAYEQ